MSRDDMIAAIELAQETLRREARLSFAQFAALRQPMDQQPALHHRVMCEALCALERGDIEGNRLMLLLPPGSAKSSYGSRLFPQYFLGKNPQLSAILASHTTGLAEGWGRKVRNGMQEQEFLDIFPAAGVSSDNASASSWSTERGGEFFSAGVGTAIAGKRADLGVIDDPIGSRQDADSDRIRERLWDWYINDFSTRLKPGAKQLLIQTRWHEADLAGMLLEREKEKWKVIKIPMLAGLDDPLGREEGEMLWKEWFTAEMLETAQRDPRSWISLYQQEPRPMEGAEFKRNWLQRYATPPKVVNKIILVDPAGDPSRNVGKRKKSDFTAMWVLVLGSDQNIYVVDGLRDRLNLTQRADALFALHKKHKPMQVRYEQYGLQADIEHVRHEMETRQYRFAIKEVGGGIEKNARIRRLIPYFEGGRIWMPYEMKRETILGTTYDVVNDFVEQEYATFPVGRYDDSFDCLARLAEPSLTLPWPKEEEMTDMSNAVWSALDNVTGY
jgi:phage terminase large subunit-like protein